MLITFQKDNSIKRIEAFADTHGNHRQYHYDRTATDILVCAGDVCDEGNERQLRDFFVWFAAQPAKFKLFVSGNHDVPFVISPKQAASYYILEGVTFIETGGITIDGVNFYVLPVRWTIREPIHLPQDIDVLVTHGAPLNILDWNGHWGCPILRQLVEKSKPKIHIFGHSHQDGQQKVEIGGTRFYNVAVKLKKN